MPTLRRFTRLGSPPSDVEQAAIREMQAIRSALATHPVAPRPCHCDPTGRNLLDTGEKVWLVDWEYSGMNDPMWDLAYFSIESLLDEAGDRALLTAYFGHVAGGRMAARMAMLKPVCEVHGGALGADPDRGGQDRRRFFRICESDVQARGGADGGGGVSRGISRRCAAAETSATRAMIGRAQPLPYPLPARGGEHAGSDPCPNHPPQDLLKAALEISAGGGRHPDAVFPLGDRGRGQARRHAR